MKKSIITLLVSLFCFICEAQDACNKAYITALQEYKKGNYTEAQRKLVVIAQTCGDYSDVWNKLKDCNALLAKQQTQQANKISLLEKNNAQLEKDKKKLEADTSMLSRAKVKAEKDNASLRKCKGVLSQDTARLQSEIRHLVDSINGLHKRIPKKDDLSLQHSNQDAIEVAINQATDSIAAVKEGIIILQAAVEQLKEIYEKQILQDDAISLKKKPLYELQDAVGELNKTLIKVLNQVKKIKPNNGNSGKQ